MGTQQPALSFHLDISAGRRHPRRVGYQLLGPRRARLHGAHGAHGLVTVGLAPGGVQHLSRRGTWWVWLSNCRWGYGHWGLDLPGGFCNRGGFRDDEKLGAKVWRAKNEEWSHTQNVGGFPADCGGTILL